MRCTHEHFTRSEDQTMSSPSNNEHNEPPRTARRPALEADAAYENAHLIARDLLRVSRNC